MLDTEAQTLSTQIGRMPESRMLLMAGLLLADKTAALEDKLREAETLNAEISHTIARMEARGLTEEAAVPDPDTAPAAGEEPALSDEIAGLLEEIAEQSEGLAVALEAKTA